MFANWVKCSAVRLVERTEIGSVTEPRREPPGMFRPKFGPRNVTSASGTPPSSDTVNVSPDAVISVPSRFNRRAMSVA